MAKTGHLAGLGNDLCVLKRGASARGGRRHTVRFHLDVWRTISQRRGQFSGALGCTSQPTVLTRPQVCRKQTRERLGEQTVAQARGNKSTLGEPGCSEHAHTGS
jgi:hypothetical protein